ncbi:unnamed protein product [Adineta steineri]|uniref:G-protein coupled receptors family 1 profile domain-containing protein n=1 Tax=Adineta steineri TaxID=433720 RepID=A0A813NWB2_9BILA|nr:unnamed protein product [Adineta steineri]
MFSISNISLSKQLESCYILRPIGYYLIFLWIIGTFLNGLVLYTLIRNKKLRQSSTNIFIGGLLLADFIGSCFELPLPAFSLIFCRWIFTYTGCVYEAIITYFTGCSNMYILCLMSIDRHNIIIHSFSKRIKNIKRPYVLICCAYLLALFWALMPLFGWSTYDYEGLGMSCSIQWAGRSFNVISYNITIFIFVYFIPMIIIFITNIKVYTSIRNRWRCNTTNRNSSRVRLQHQIERRVALTISFIIGGFFMAWTPYAIFVLIRIFMNGNYFPPIMDTIPALFAKTSLMYVI